jgi:hypothetical protein
MNAVMSGYTPVAIAWSMARKNHYALQSVSRVRRA